MGNHLVSDSAAAINAGEDESILDGNLGRSALGTVPRRRRHGDDDDETDIFEDDDIESMASMTVDGANGKKVVKAEEEVELPAHACAYVAVGLQHGISRSLIYHPSDTAASTTPAVWSNALLAASGSAALVETRPLHTS